MQINIDKYDKIWYGIAVILVTLTVLFFNNREANTEINAEKDMSKKNMSKIEAQIMIHEGFRSSAYKCPAGKVTIGYGRNLDDCGITENEALMLLRNDIKLCELDLIWIFPDFKRLSKNRQNCLIDMRYNLGGGGFRQFIKMIRAIKADDFVLASKEMTDSTWYRQVGRRGMFLKKQMVEG